MGKHYKKAWCRERGRRQRVHRMVAAHCLGRELATYEVVHHIDGDKGNNSPGNLAVMPGHAEHGALEHVLRLARQGLRPLFTEMLYPFEIGEYDLRVYKPLGRQ